MRLVVLITATLVANAALAGCLADETQEGNDNTDTDGDGVPDGNVTLPPPPLASFFVTIDGNMTEAENGSIAANVGLNLTFDASSSSGQNVTFAWDMGDGTTFGVVPEGGAPADDNETGNGTGGNETAAPLALPFENAFQPEQTNGTSNDTTEPIDDNSVVVYAYLTEGNYTVTLYVTDDADQTTTSTADITVTPSGPAPGTFIRLDTITFSQASTSATTACAGSQTKDWMFIDVEVENGTAVEVKNVSIVMDTTGGTNVNGASRIYFIGPDGKEIKSSTSGYGDKTLAAEGPFPAGKYQVKAELCQIVLNAAYTVTAKAMYVAR